MERPPVGSRRGVLVMSFVTLLAVPLLLMKPDTGTRRPDVIAVSTGAGVAADLDAEPVTTTTTPAVPPVATTTTPAAPATTTTPAAPDIESTTTTAAPATTTTTAPPPPPPAPPPAPTTTTTTAPAESSTGTQEGKASWYDHEAGTCAHRTLPFGTIVTVTNLDNGRSTTCRVADRGPFVEGWIIDLDRRVFAQIADPSTGVIPVRIRW